ncbi:hypothetical protein [Streptacidiphilus albus]|uniref:hypothetical protein n=1 Tax=Streptacidiphilus albus TaxID=105425 RepID=UPI00054B7E9B|nr:hypothetical protein [Streptacidiphilus albus]
MATTPIDSEVVAVGGTAPDPAEARTETHNETRTDSCTQTRHDPRARTRPSHHGTHGDASAHAPAGAHSASGRSRHPLRCALRNTGIVLDTAWRVVLLGDEGMKAR